MTLKTTFKSEFKSKPNPPTRSMFRGLLVGLFLVVCLPLLPASPEDTATLSPPIKEVRDLHEKGKHALVLEKSLDLLNTRSGTLSADDTAALHFYLGMAYKNEKKPQKALEYFKKIEGGGVGAVFLKSVYLAMAEIYSGDYFKRVAYLEKVFEQFPRTPEAVRAGEALARDFLKLKNFKMAIPVLEVLVNLWKKADERPELNLLLALAYSGVRDYIEAIVYLRKAEKTIQPIIVGNPHYLFEAGKICHNNANFKKATVYLERLFNIFPDYKEITEAVILLALSHERLKNLFLGAVYLIKGLEKKPPEKYIFTLYLNLGRIMGNLSPEELQKVAENYPNYADIRKLLVYVKDNSLNFEERRTAAILLSDEYKKDKNMKLVVENFYRFLGEKRDPLVARLFTRNLGEYLQELDGREHYQEIFKTWVKLKHRKSYLSGDNLLLFGDILYRLGLTANALEVYRHLLEYKLYGAQWPVARRQLARINFQQGKYSACLTHIDALALKEGTDSNEFTCLRLLCYRSLGHSERVEKMLENIRIKDVFDIHGYRLGRMKAELLEKRKKFSDALDVYQHMVGFDGMPLEDEGTMMAAIGGLYYDMKDPQTALTYYRLAEKFGADPEWVLFRVVTILRELGEGSRAAKEMERLKQVAPRSFWLDRLRKDAGKDTDKNAGNDVGSR